MAGEQRARDDFSEILTSLERKFEIILVKWVNNKDFEIRIRTEIDRDNDDFNGPKIRFRKQYQCWTQGGGKIQKELLFDARKCKGVLDMKVLTDTPLTRRKNKHIRMGLNAVVKINFNHLHPVNVEVPYSFFVHNCPPQPDPILPPLQQTTQIQQTLQPMKHMPQPTPIQITVPDMSEPLLMCQPTIMFDTSLTTHSLSLPHHVVHSHAHVHHNQHTTPHGHYL
ncbi:hypothetical protein CBL_02833 [Carabus blaptoides fortunei]